MIDEIDVEALFSFMVDNKTKLLNLPLLVLKNLRTLSVEGQDEDKGNKYFYLQ